MNKEEIVDAEFEEIIERDVVLTSDLSDEDLEKLKDVEENDAGADVSADDAAAFARQMQDEIDAEKAQLKEAATNEPQEAVSQMEMMRALKGALKEGGFTKARKQRMMQEMGIYQSTFTKKQKTKSVTAKKRKQQKKARRKNRK
jgi:hypothetical protein